MVPPLVVPPGYPDDWRARLRAEVDRARRSKLAERDLVAQALAAGATWSGIARELGVSRQTAHRKYRSLRVTVQL